MQVLSTASMKILSPFPMTVGYWGFRRPFVRIQKIAWETFCSINGLGEQNKGCSS